MTGRSLGTLVACLALVIAGCGPDGATTETEPSDTEPPTSETVPTTSETEPTTGDGLTGSCNEVRLTAEGELVFPAMLFVPGLVAVDEDRGPDAVSQLGEDVVTVTDATAAFGVVSSLEGASFENYDGRLVGEIDGLVDFLEVSGDVSPLDVALELRQIEADLGLREFSAAPISAVGFVGHWGYRPGSEPAPISVSGDLQVVFEVEVPDIGGYVGVVDSGIDDSNLPSWMQSEAVIYDGEDIETAADASHGTFVADLIRRIAPEYGVSLAKAHTVPGTSYDVFPENHDKPQLQVSNELDVAYAVMRLIDRGIEYSALNLSLGAYIPDPNQPDLQLTLLRNVLAGWEGGSIYAAAGNEDLTLLHFPAALTDPDVESVAAGDSSLTPVPSLASSASQWFDHTAPGVDLVGLAGGVDADGANRLVCWSGSSFATAVATATTVQHNTMTFDYQIPGLTYIDSSGSLVVNP